MSSFVKRATSNQAASPTILDFRDPDNLPGMDVLMHNAHARVERDSIESAPRWTALAKKLKGADVINQRIQRMITKADWVIEFKLPYARVYMFRDDVVLYSKSLLDSAVDKPALQELWKGCGLPLYGMDFGSYAVHNLVDGKFNGVRLGYYSSLSGPKAKARMKAILLTAAYMKKAATP